MNGSECTGRGLFYHRDSGGRHEMTPEQHKMLLFTIRECEARVMLSGYRSELYDDMLSNPRWKRHELKIDNKSGKGEKKQDRIECLWTNF